MPRYNDLLVENLRFRNFCPAQSKGLPWNLDVDVDVVDLRAQADASMPASNNNVKLYNISNF